MHADATYRKYQNMYEDEGALIELFGGILQSWISLKNKTYLHTQTPYYSSCYFEFQQLRSEEHTPTYTYENG